MTGASCCAPRPSLPPVSPCAPPASHCGRPCKRLPPADCSSQTCSATPPPRRKFARLVNTLAAGTVEDGSKRQSFLSRRASRNGKKNSPDGHAMLYIGARLFCRWARMSADEGTARPALSVPRLAESGQCKVVTRPDRTSKRVTGHFKKLGGRFPRTPPDRTRKAVAVFGVLTLLTDGRHALHLLGATIERADSLATLAACLWNLPDLQFAGFLWYATVLVGSVYGIAWATIPTIGRHARRVCRALHPRAATKRPAQVA